MFKKAERRQAKLKLSVTGPSGSGKTYSSLLIASGIGKKIAVIDTENKSAALYSDRFEFDLCELEPPYTVAKYVDAIKAAASAGYDVLIVDSISHQWAGEGGILEKKTAIDSTGGNSFTNWGKLTPEQERFKSAILQSDVHMICTMRSKQEYVMETNERGKQSPKKVGLAPIQRDGMEYEFTTVLDLSIEHYAKASKDRTGLFDGQFFIPSKETGEKLMKWLSTGKVMEKPKVMAPAPEPETERDVEPEKPKGPPVLSGVYCDLCGAECRLHSSGVGYICAKAAKKGDGHLRFELSQLEELQKKAVKQWADDAAL